MDKNAKEYLQTLESNVKARISSLLTPARASAIALSAFKFHFNDNKGSIKFQKYYCEITESDSAYKTPAFFEQFKKHYSLQAIDKATLKRFTKRKVLISKMIKNDQLSQLFLQEFSNLPIKHGEKKVEKTLGSFFTKLVHTLRPTEYCALDNPIKKYFGLKSESFFTSFVVISSAYRNWISENQPQMALIRKEFKSTKGKPNEADKFSDLKLLDLIFWLEAKNSQKLAKKKPDAFPGAYP